jgi:hypothetical protein
VSILPRIVFIACVIALLPVLARAAQTTGALAGRVIDESGKPVAGASVHVSSPSASRNATTDADGRFTVLELDPDRYIIVVRADGMQEQRVALNVPAARTASISIPLDRLATITTVRAHAQTGVRIGAVSDLYTLGAAQAQAPLLSTSSGLASYTQGLAQGAAARAPGVQEDQFANAIVRGGRTNDTLYLYDGVPVAQALIAEPGGNVIGAQLPTTGVAFTDVYLGGFSGPDAALGGVINEVPARGTYPVSSTFTTNAGSPSAADVDLTRSWASPDLRRRYAVDLRSATTAFSYGDGTTFYPAEAATYGLALANRASSSVAATASFATGASSDLALSALAGNSVSDQYGTPLTASSIPEFDSQSPSRIRGTFGVLKAAWTQRHSRSSTVLALYRSYYYALTNAPFFDDLSFPNGPVSYFGTQHGALDGLRFDVHVFPSARHELTYGIDTHVEVFALDQQVPQLEDGDVNAAPVSNSYIAYANDVWHLSDRLTVSSALRLLHDLAHSGAFPAFTTTALDPHLSAVYDAGHDVVRALYDHVSVPPHALELALAQTPLSTEHASTVELSYEHHGASTSRFTYYNRQERDRIDLFPLSGEIAIPQNVGDLNSHGFEFSYARGGLSLSATYQDSVASSAEQFAVNDLNAAALAAGHLFPIGYVPKLTALAAWHVHSGVFEIVPSISWESGYPYGNGTRVWVFDASGRPVSVPNDNHINPGYNYWFLRDPSQPYDAATNPYIGSLNSGEGNDPNTLLTPPQLLASLHVEAPVRTGLRIALDIANLFGVASPTQLQGNPYLIGPPGYAGGDPRYSAWYANVIGTGAYTLGNGVPTRDGTTQGLPWTYGRGAYVPSSYPQARSFALRLEWSL